MRVENAALLMSGGAGSLPAYLSVTFYSDGVPMRFTLQPVELSMLDPNGNLELSNGTGVAVVDTFGLLLDPARYAITGTNMVAASIARMLREGGILLNAGIGNGNTPNPLFTGPPGSLLGDAIDKKTGLPHGCDGIMVRVHSLPANAHLYATDIGLEPGMFGNIIPQPSGIHPANDSGYEGEGSGTGGWVRINSTNWPSLIANNESIAALTNELCIGDAFWFGGKCLPPGAVVVNNKGFPVSDGLILMNEDVAAIEESYEFTVGAVEARLFLVFTPSNVAATFTYRIDRIVADPVTGGGILIGGNPSGIYPSNGVPTSVTGVNTQQVRTEPLECGRYRLVVSSATNNTLIDRVFLQSLSPRDLGG